MKPDAAIVQPRWNRQQCTQPSMTEKAAAGRCSGAPFEQMIPAKASLVAYSSQLAERLNSLAELQTIVAILRIVHGRGVEANRSSHVAASSVPIFRESQFSRSPVLPRLSAN